MKDIELLNTVLAVTREQLSRSMNLCAELEAMLSLEKKKNAALSREIETLKAEKE